MKKTNLLDIISNESSFNLAIVFVAFFLSGIAGLWYTCTFLWARFYEWAGQASVLLAISLAINILIIPLLAILIGKSYAIGLSKAQDYKTGIDAGMQSTTEIISNMARSFSRQPQVKMIDEQVYLPPPPEITIIGD